MNDATDYSNDRLASVLKQALSEETADSDLQWSYREAASVLSYFDMNSLKPLAGFEPNKDEALKSLEMDSWLVPDSNRKLQWTLKSDLRKAALQRLQTEDNIKKALEANPDRPQDPLQQTLESYVFHRAEPLEAQTSQQLFDTLQIAEWLKGIVEGVPDPAVVRQKIEKENLLAPFRFLVGNHFRGRDAELERLSDYVGINSPSSLATLVSRGIKAVLSIREKLPLFIYGPGGVGKSTLLAKFILDHVNRFERKESGDSQPGAEIVDNRFPFAYLDFDRPSLIAEEPITLMLEALRQLEIQYPEFKVSLSRVRESWLQRLASRAQRKREAAEPNSPPANIRIDNRTLFFDEFAEELKLLTREEKPFLLVLDTFEEVQYRSSAFVEEVFKFLDDLQKRIPTLRTVLSGRAQFASKNFTTDDLQLAKFDVEVSQGFLMAHGISDPVLAKRIAEQVGGSPLTLKLAVELLRHEDPDGSGIRDLKVRDSLLRKLEDEAIQAQLFTRILAHIHDPEVEKLAHPGLVLRRITPELILKVLAKPCGVEVKDLDQAKVLFQKLSREVALVTQTGTDVLVHRPDLRSVMLEPLRKNKKEAVIEIHNAAIGYYEQFDDDISRAEEIYHRLSLDFEQSVVTSRWRDSVRQYLGTAIEELPKRGKAYLAARLGLEVDEDVWLEADLEDWETHTQRRARDLLELKQPLDALAVLRQRSQRTGSSPLLALERDVILAALTDIHSLFSVYETQTIKRAAMDKVYEALGYAVSKLSIRPETLISIRKDLKLQKEGGGNK